MSSTLTRKKIQSNQSISTSSTDLDSFDLDLFDQLASKPRKNSHGIRFHELSEDEEALEENVTEDEYEEELDDSNESEYDQEEESEEEYVPARVARTTSRAVESRGSVSGRNTSRTYSRPNRTGANGGEKRASRTISSVSGRSISSRARDTDVSASTVASVGRSAYGFPVRTTANSSQNRTRLNDSSNSWSLSSINGTGFQVGSDQIETESTSSERTCAAQSVTSKPQKKTNSFFRFCKTIFIIVVIVVGIWAIYGVSVESNLGFWQQTFQSEISYVHDALRSLPSPLLMMIDQP